MAIRDIVVIVIILLAAPVALFSPYFGILMWNWIAYFNPHRYAWGIARFGFFQPAMHYCGSYVTWRALRAEKLRIWTRETVLLAGLWFWLAFTTFYISHRSGICWTRARRHCCTWWKSAKYC